MTPGQSEKVDAILEEIYTLMDRKSKDYSDEMIMQDKEDNVSKLGIAGVYVRMTDKMARLYKMIWLNKEAEIKEEGTEDALKDLAVYCIIGLMLMRKVWKIK